jgi:trans-2-enoyl-CoA reductase
MLKPKIAFECIGGETSAIILKLLEEEGELYHYGNLSLKPLSNILTNDFIFMDKKIYGFWLFKYLNSHKDKNKLFENYKNDLNTNNAEIYETNINKIFKPENFEEAIKIYKNEMSKGKVLLDFTTN